MLDLSHIPNSQQDVQIFYSNGAANAWQTWNKPRKCNYVWIMCIGGGGGGGGGRTGGSSNFGGGSGAVSKVLYNSQLLSDILYIQVGRGGAGGIANNSGANGQRSFVSLRPISTVVQNIVAVSGGTAAIAGGGGTPFGETASTQANATFYTLGNFQSSAGQTAPIANVVTPLTSQITCAGASGRENLSLAFGSGYNVISTSISPTIQGGIATSTISGSSGNGENGLTYWKPFFSLGGAGAGVSTNGFGGNGGNGGIGSGGGGGGNGQLGGGRGGNGGDGLVIIISF